MTSSVRVKIIYGRLPRTLRQMFINLKLTSVGNSLVLRINPTINNNIMRIRQIPSRMDRGASHVLVRQRNLRHRTTINMTPRLQKRQLPYNTIRSLPPTNSVIINIRLRRLQTSTLRRQGNRNIAKNNMRTNRGMTLLRLIQIHLNPHIVLTNNMVNKMSLYINVLRLLQGINTITIASNVHTPLFRSLRHFKRRIRVNQSHCTPNRSVFFRKGSPLPLFSSVPVKNIVRHRRDRRRHRPRGRSTGANRLPNRFPTYYRRHSKRRGRRRRRRRTRNKVVFPRYFRHLSPCPFEPPAIVPYIDYFYARVCEVEINDVAGAEPTCVIPC